MYQGDEQSQLDLRLFRIWSRASKAIINNTKIGVSKNSWNQS